MIIIILIILLLVGIYFIRRKFSDYALKTDSNADEEIKKAIIQNGQLLNKAQETENEKKNEALEWISKQRTNTINITSNDNLTLYAQYIKIKHTTMQYLYMDSKMIIISCKHMHITTIIKDLIL